MVRSDRNDLHAAYFDRLLMSTRHVQTTVRKMIPTDLRIPLNCSRCGFEFVRTFEELSKNDGCHCPGCGADVTLKDSPVRDQIRLDAASVRRKVDGFLGHEFFIP
jgi:DNA-directed RNA polymerase subunit RPC12/RpoP